MSTSINVGQSDLRLLRVFATIVEFGGFTPAQVAMNVSQSTISSHMAALEARLDMRLCERGRGGFRLTENGKQVYEAAQRLFRSLDLFGSEVDALRGQLSGELHVAIVDSIISNPDFALSDALARFGRRSGNVQVSLHIAAPAEIERGVVEGRFHIGLGGYTQGVSAIEYTPLLTETQRLYCGSKHPIHGMQAGDLAPSSLRRHKFVKRAYVPDTHIPHIDLLSPAAQAENMEATAFLIMSGDFIGFLPEHYAARWVADGTMMTILPDRFAFNSQLELLIRRTFPRTPAADYLKIDILNAFGRA